MKNVKSIIFDENKDWKNLLKLPYNFVFFFIQLFLLNEIYEEVEGLE